MAHVLVEWRARRRRGVVGAIAAFIVQYNVRKLEKYVILRGLGLRIFVFPRATPLTTRTCTPTCEFCIALLSFIEFSTKSASLPVIALVFVVKSSILIRPRTPYYDQPQET